MSLADDIAPLWDALRANARLAIREQFTQRGKLALVLIGQYAAVYTRLAIWTAAYATQGIVMGASLDQMLSYAIIAALVATLWDPMKVVDTMGTAVSTGTIAGSLLRPSPYLLLIGSRVIGEALFRLFLVAVPLLVVFAVTFGVHPPSSGASLGLSVILLAEGLAIGFLVAVLFGLVAFWTLTSFSLEWLLQGLITLLSGVFVPLWLFPPVLATFLSFSPFAYMSYLPTAVYLGRLDPVCSGLHAAIGILWVLGLGLALRVLWGQAVRAIEINGG